MRVTNKGRATMKIWTLWHKGDDGDAPWIVDAVDEYTIDNNCDFPPKYLEKRHDGMHRELIIDVPEDAVRKLFDPTAVAAVVVTP